PPPASSAPSGPLLPLTSREAGDWPGVHGRPQRGTGTEFSALSSTELTDTPSSSASGRSESRCPSVACASALTSSGVTNERPLSHAQARAVLISAVAPRGLTPSCSDGDCRVAR